MDNSSNVGKKKKERKKEKKISIDDIAANLARFFSVADRMASSIAKTAALFPGHNRTAMIHHQL